MKTVSAILAALLLFSPHALSQHHAESGTISVYADHVHGHPTASGELYDLNGLTAAHASLPLGTFVRVANFDTGKMVDVRINDRKPSDTVLLSVSRHAAKKLGMSGNPLAAGSILVVELQPSSGGFGGGLFSGGSERKSPFSDFGKRQAMKEAVNNPDASVSVPQPSSYPEKTGLFGKRKNVQYGIPAHQYEPYKTSPNGGALASGQVESPAGSSEPFGELIPMSANGTPGATSGPAPMMQPMNASRTPPPATSGIPYRVQFGAFRKQSNANQMAGDLIRSGVGATVVQSKANGLFLVVTSGTFSSAEQAQHWADVEGSRRGWRERPVVIR